MKTIVGQIKTIFLIIFYITTFSANSTNFYSDPVNGSMSNTGSSVSPLASLSSIFTANKTFLSGDTIFLRSGNHGYVTIHGTNKGFVVITPETGQMPVITRINVSAGDFWKLYKLTVQSESSGAALKGDYSLVELSSYSSNIIVSDCDISSNPNTTGWSRDDWRRKCNFGITTKGRLNANHIIEKNRIRNVSLGLTISSSNTIARENTVQYFTNDGSRVLGSNVLFEKNKVLDLMKVMLVSENHDDLFQSFTYPAGGTGQDTLKNVIIRDNLFVTCTDTTRAFRGSSQGIGCFDGPFLNWTVENNIVLVDHWHGITMYGAINCKIINNTVLDPYPYTPYNSYDKNSTVVGPAWISIGQIYTRVPSINNIVKNNLVHYMIDISSTSMGTGTNNITIGTINNFKSYFVNASDLSNPGKFDLHLKSGSSAVNAGDAEYAPLDDYDGVLRPQGSKYDIGAYEYVPATVIAEINTSRNPISISPNPFTNELSIQSTAGFKKGDRIHIYNIDGQLVYGETLTASTHKIELNKLSTIPSGLLLIKVDGSEGFKYSLKLIKEN